MSGTATFDPVATVEAVDRGAEEIERAAADLAKAIHDKEVAEHAYLQAKEVELIKIYDAAKKAGERLPAEDVRQALAHRNLPEGVYKTHLVTKAAADGAEKLFRAKMQAVSARQSVLKALGGLA